MAGPPSGSGPLLLTAINDTTPGAGYPVQLDRVQEDVPVAQRAVIVHQPEHWPAGCFCRNCKTRWPCRLHAWGLTVLQAAGWTGVQIGELVRRAKAGEVPWA
jgi:hypothetical protein